MTIYLTVARFRLNSIDDGAFGAIDADHNGVNDGFRRENDAEDAVFRLNGIDVRDKCCIFVADLQLIWLIDRIIEFRLN